MCGFKAIFSHGQRPTNKIKFHYRGTVMKLKKKKVYIQEKGNVIIDVFKTKVAVLGCMRDMN